MTGVIEIFLKILLWYKIKLTTILSGSVHAADITGLILVVLA